MMSPDRSLLDAVTNAIGGLVTEQSAFPAIVGLCGAQGSGKSTLARAVATRLEGDLRHGDTSEGAHVMTREQIARFVQHYERLSRFMLAEMPARADLTVLLDASRGAVSIAAHLNRA